MKKTILVTGASSGFGKMISQSLALDGHLVFASMRDIEGKNAVNAERMKEWAVQNNVEIIPIELDVQSSTSIQEAKDRITHDYSLDVIVHNAGHMVYGPAEAFTIEQYSQIYDVNVLGTQRINKAFLPHMRKKKDGYIVWIGSSSTSGGTPPYLGPYFAAKAALDSLAVSYASELSLWGIESTIIVPGAFTKGTNHFAHAGRPDDVSIAKEYDDGPYHGISEQAFKELAKLEPAEADPKQVAEAIVRIMQLDKGKRPFRVHVDPSEDGAREVNAVGDRMRKEIFEKMGLSRLLKVV